MRNTLKNIARLIIEVISMSFLLCYSLFNKLIINNDKKIIFSSSPIKNNYYWSKALKERGIPSITFMTKFYDKINKRVDFDLYFGDVIPRFVPKRISGLLNPFFSWLYIIRNAKVIVKPFSPISFNSSIWRVEYYLCKINNIKVVILPYGSDSYIYSDIQDKSLQFALLSSYPQYARYNELIQNRVNFWSKNADVIITGFMQPDGFPRTDMLIPSIMQIDTNEWMKKVNYSRSDGYQSPVKIVHTPNHRGFKGTEYIIDAVNKLVEEGLKIELILLEGVQNSKVNEILKTADILVEQLIFPGYALSGIEGMATGLPVISNLESENYILPYKRFSFLSECPIYSSSPEKIENTLRELVINPELRENLGSLGREYVEKYHSFAFSNHMFDAIFSRLNNEDIDLINYYHPLKSDYVKLNKVSVLNANNPGSACNDN